MEHALGPSKQPQVKRRKKVVLTVNKRAPDQVAYRRLAHAEEKVGRDVWEFLPRLYSQITTVYNITATVF